MEIQNISSLFLSSYRNTCGSLQKTRKRVEALALHARAQVPKGFLTKYKLASQPVILEGACDVKYYTITIAIFCDSRVQ